MLNPRQSEKAQYNPYPQADTMRDDHIFTESTAMKPPMDDGESLTRVHCFSQ